MLGTANFQHVTPPWKHFRLSRFPQLQFFLTRSCTSIVFNFCLRNFKLKLGNTNYMIRKVNVADWKRLLIRFSSQVKSTSQDAINEFIIRKLNPLVVVDFRFIFRRPFELHDGSLENAYICLLKWPPQHRNCNSNLVRFGMNFWLHKRCIRDFLWKLPRYINIRLTIQILCRKLRFCCQRIFFHKLLGNFLVLSKFSSFRAILRCRNSL